MQEKQTSHSLVLMEGKTLKSKILSSIQKNLIQLPPEKLIRPPCLVIVLVGDDPSSLVYVKQKILAGENIGIQIQLLHLPKSITEQEVKIKLYALNKNPYIHGIILQLPVPTHIHAPNLIESIDPKKDVDGFHPLNIGKLSMGEKPYFYSATPLATLKLLQHYNITISGKNIVILNRSNIVGKPLASLLGSKNSYGNGTVTICHTYTKNIKEYTLNADILITATSLPRSIKADIIKPDAVLVDLGQAVEERNGTRYIIGDIDHLSVQNKASALTPVPGGVGPMTVATLMENIFKAFIIQNHLEKEVQYDFF